MRQVRESIGVPSPGGDRAASLVAAIWEQFCVRQVWPKWVEVDQQLYRAGVRFDEARDELALGLVSGIGLRGRMLPSPDQRLSLTIGGIANCPTGGDHVRTFLLLVQYAVKLEREWDYSSDQQPWFSFQEASRSVAVPPGTPGQTLLRQVLSVIDEEPWSGGYGGDGDDRRFQVSRAIREFVGARTLSEYWAVRDRLTRPFDADQPVSYVPMQVRSQPSAIALAANQVLLDIHPLLHKALSMYEDGHMTEAADTALREVEVRIGALSERASELLPGESFGQRRITAALRPDGGPILNVSHADAGYDQGEQDGMKFLFMGVYAGLRNPIGHRKFRPSDSAEVAEILAVASMCMRRLDTAESRLPAN